MIPGFDVQNPRALNRAAASFTLDPLLHSGTRKWTRTSDREHEQMGFEDGKYQIGIGR